MNTETLNWRYAVKKYDPAKKVSDADLETLKNAIRLSASSMGMQPYRVLIITDPEVKAKLAEVSYNNKNSIIDASHVIVFANMVNVGSADVDAFIQNIADVREIPLESLAGYAGMAKGFISSKEADALNTWTSKQTYIALANLLNAAAELRIDTTPMEGFDPQAYNTILGLDAQNLNAAVVATIGYRHEEDSFQHLKKVRKPASELFINL